MRIAITVILIAFSASGCATIVKGSSDTVTVDTRPPGAVCELKRDGQTIAIINPTPGSISVSKSKYDINVRCEKEEFEDAVGVVGSEFQAMTFGNILFGGLIGVAVDAGSGALNEYPPIVTITLVPKEFENEIERDEFFDDMRDEFLVQYEQTIARIKVKCGDDQALCDEQLQAAERARVKKFQEIEDRRIRAALTS